MPRKCISNSTKQKNRLKRRLMQIQMVIEDYVYNGKNISAGDAKGYLEEVSGYRAQGIKDARFLQVIEKITRCMKGILEEQQEEAHSDDTNCPSPVYSLPEEDKILFTQEPMNIDNTENLNGTRDLFDDDDVEQPNVQKDVEIHRAMSELSIREDEQQIFEQCSQSILQSLKPVVVEKVGTPKPNLKINQVEFQPKPNLKTNQIEFLRKTTQDLNSKAAIFTDDNRIVMAAENFATNNMQYVDNDVIFVEPTQPSLQHSEPDVVGILKKFKTGFNINSEFPKEPMQGLNLNNSTFTDHSTIPSQKLAIKNVHFQDDAVTFLEPNPPINKTKAIIEKKINKNGTEKKTRRKKNLNKNEKKNVTTEKRKMKIDGKQKRVNKTDNKTKKQFEKPVKTVDNNINALQTSTNDLNNPNKNIAKVIQNRATNVDLYKRHEQNGNTYNKNKENYKATAKIYNKSTENDLSWIENIRYVREVANEEFVGVYFEESFWDNLMFPSDWNDKDFDY